MEIEDEEEEVNRFMEEEAAKAKRKNQLHNKQPLPQEDDRLFMQKSWSEQYKLGTKVPVLRLVEGDSVRQRLRTYRRTIYFHIHAALNHNAYVYHRLQNGGVNQDPNGKDEKGRTALHYACRNGASTTVQTLLFEEATIDDPDLEMRWTPLHYAVMGGHAGIVDYLIEKSPLRRITVNRKDACGEDNATIAKILLQKKAFIDATDEDNWTALHYAAVNDAALTTEVLLRYDCNTETRTDSTHETALEMAERLKCHLVAIQLYEFVYRKPILTT